MVVYRTIPTSNHNLFLLLRNYLVLYIVLFLHQTTTHIFSINYRDCCISYYSYIKPQPMSCWKCVGICCISYYSYIKPQPVRALSVHGLVVYRTIPTSNHNYLEQRYWRLHVVYRTIPTSNHNSI